MKDKSIARFWSKVDTSGNCWEWTAPKTRYGYGDIMLERQRFRAHRFSYMLANGPIPEGLHVDHICHNRGCVNPEHLRLATAKENQENHSGPSAANTSGVRGVSWHKVRKKWSAHARHNHKNHCAGFFLTIEEAEAAVIALRLELHTRNDADRAA